MRFARISGVVPCEIRGYSALSALLLRRFPVRKFGIGQDVQEICVTLDENSLRAM